MGRSENKVVIIGMGPDIRNDKVYD